MNVFVLSLWRGFRTGFTTLGDDVSTLINSILLLIVYVVGVGITSLVAKIVGKKFLNRNRADTDIDTHWDDIENEKPALDTYFRQF